MDHIEKKEETLFEGLDFSSFADEFSQMIPAVNPEENNVSNDINQNDIIEKNNESQSVESTEEDAEKNPNVDLEKDSENLSSSPLTLYAKLLVDEGILRNLNLEEFDGTAESLTTAMSKEIDFGINSYKEQLPDELKKIIDYYEEGVPLMNLLEIQDRRVQYKSINDNQIAEDKNLAKAILKDYYKQTSQFSEEKIDKLIQRSDDLDELTDEAKSSLKELITLQDEYERQELEDAKEFKLRQEKLRTESLNELKNKIDVRNEIIPGGVLTKDLKDKIYKNLTTPVVKDSNGNFLNAVGKYKLENPMEFDILLGYLYETTKGFKDWSVLNKTGRKDAITQFENSVKTNDKFSTKEKMDHLNNPKAKSTLKVIEELF
jgi:hypothetical protein